MTEGGDDRVFGKNTVMEFGNFKKRGLNVLDFPVFAEKVSEIGQESFKPGKRVIPFVFWFYKVLFLSDEEMFQAAYRTISSSAC